MKALPRPSWWLVAVLLLLTMAASSCVTVGVQWARQFNPPLPPLIRDLGGGSWDASSAALTDRIRRRIPLGTSEADLIRELAAEGFQAGWPTDSGEHEAAYAWSTLVCGMRASVFWRIDADRRITSLRGKYHETGCL